jgi:hypothetical protein
MARKRAHSPTVKTADQLESNEQITCDSCGRKLQIDERLARLKCQHCQYTIPREEERSPQLQLPVLYLDLRARVDAYKDPSSRESLVNFITQALPSSFGPDDRHDVNRVVEYALQLFNRDQITYELFERLDSWLRVKSGFRAASAQAGDRSKTGEQKSLAAKVEENASLEGLPLKQVADWLQEEICPRSHDKHSSRRHHQIVEANSREGMVLGVLFKNDLTSRNRRWTTARIEMALYLARGSCKRAVAKLASEGLVKTQQRAGGGVWLTAQGKAAAGKLPSAAQG